jgi:hypothetical protein
LEKQEFNTDEGDAIVRFLNDICVGRVVAVVSRGDVSGISSQAKKAIANIGGHVIEFVQDEASYVLLGRKGSSPGIFCFSTFLSFSGSGLELSTLKGASSVEFRFPYVQKSLLQIFASSSCGNSSIISIDHQEYQGTTGLHVVTVYPSGIVVNSQNFTSLVEFANWVDGLANGTIVVAAIRSPLESLSTRVLNSLISIGSSLCSSINSNSSYSIIGMKGEEPGSVPEHLCSGNTAISEYWLPYNRAPTSFRSMDFFSRYLVQSAGYNVGDSYSIIGRKQKYQSGGVGMNLVVFDESNGAKLEENCYDTHGDWDQSTSLAALIEGLPAGRLVAIAGFHSNVVI